MARQLVAFVDGAPEDGGPDSGAAPPQGSPFARWPSIEHARSGGFEHLILISSVRFRWDEVVAHVADRELAPPEPSTPPRAPAAPAGEGPAEAPKAVKPAKHAEAEEPPEAEPAPEAPAAEDAAPSPEADAHAEAGGATSEDDAHSETGGTAAEDDAHSETGGPAVEDDAHSETGGTAAEADAHSETGGAVAASSEKREARQEKKPGGERRPPPKSVEDLRSRLHHMAQTGRIDRNALDALGRELSRELGIASVACRVLPPFSRDREQVSFIRSVLGLIRPHEPVAMDFADGPRSVAALGLTLAHGLASLRPDVPLTELTMDRARNLGFHPKSLLHAIEIQELWRDVTRGTTPIALVEHMRQDPRLQVLAAPYQRYARALEFGSPAEAARAARTVHQRIAELVEKGVEKDDWIAAIQPALDAMTGGLVAEQPWSRRQIWMADASSKRGMHFLTALHLREALISGLLEAYGQNAARGWAATGPGGETQQADSRVRPREVMAVILGDPHSFRIVPDLGEVWKWVGNPRSRFVMTSPVAVDPAILRDGNHALANMPTLVRAILDEGRFKAIVEALPYEAAIEVAIGRNAVRIAPVRGKRGRRGEGDAEHGGGEGAPHEGEGAADAGGQAEAGPGGPPRDFRPRTDGPRFRPPPRDRRPPPRQDRPPRPAFDRPRPGPDRPREVTAHDRRGPPRGPRPSDGDVHATSIPVGGTIEVGRASQGLGNLGFALKNAGLNPTPKGTKERPPRKDAAPAEHRPSAPPPAESSAEASAASAPPPAPPPEPAKEAAPAPAPAPDFDVAGPS
jgi:hypothetical protein